MIQSEMNNRGLPFLAILTGMGLTQVFFTWMVYCSNLDLYHNMLAIGKAGYLPVPNQHILPSLQQLGTAMKGAVFFSLTVGIVLPFLVYLAAWAWDRGYRRNRVFLIVLSGFVIFCMMMVNRHGFNPIVTIWFLAVYLTVFKLTLYGLQGVQTRLSPGHLFTHLAVLAVLGVAWTTLPKDTNFFLAVRDHLLLSNSFGERITDFYYRYSPYPTHAYKPLRKKQLKACLIEGEPTGNISDRLKAALLRYDYLPVDSYGDSDLAIIIRDDRLLFSVNDRTVLKTGIDEFLQNPAELLDRVSSRTDRNDFTRRLLAFSLFYGLPIFLYACLFCFFRLVFGCISGRFSAFRFSATACLAVGIAAMLMFRIMSSEYIPVQELKAALESEDPGVRVAALRSISRLGLDLSEYCEAPFADERSSVSERIWWTISLGNTAAPKAAQVLLRLLDDPQPLVVCKAYDSLAKLEYRPAIPIIVEKLGASRHWYVQGYAYGALRSLGWKQKASS